MLSSFSIVFSLVIKSFYCCCYLTQKTAFRLADAGYDVWLGNSRGNIYSRRHAWLETDDPQFWQYT